MNNEQNSPETQALPPAQSPKWYKKKSTIVILVVILLAIGGLIAWILMKNSDKPAEKASSTTESSGATTETAPYFYLGPDTKSVSVYNPETKVKSSISISASENEALRGAGISSNKSVQVSADGKVVAYATENLTNCGEGGCEVTDTFIYAKTGGTAEQLVKLPQPQALDDWLLTADGKTIFYLVNMDSSKMAGLDLHKVTLSDKKDTLVKQNIFAANVNKTPMFAVGNDAFRVYDNQTGMVEYRYEAGAVTNKELNVDSFCADCRAEYGQPLSPDGKTLVLESGSIPNNFVYHTLDLTNNTHKQIFKTAKTTEQPIGVYWAPDGSAIAYDIGANGSEGQNEVGLKSRFEIYEIASGETTVGFSDPSPGVDDQNYNNHFVELLGWSFDSGYIAFLNNDMVKVYKLADATSADTGISIESPLSSSVGHGWYKQ
jgi:hypothetical protein